MHVAVDARELTGRPTGVGTYLRQLLGHWQQMPDACAQRWTLYVPESLARAAEGRGEALSARHLPADARCRTVPGRGGTLWEQGALAAAIRHDRPDILFAPGYTAPLTVAVPVVLTVHDVSFAAHPEWFSAREGFRRRLLTRWSARRARIVLTVSDFSRREIISRFDVPAARVRAIPHGISRPSSPPPLEPRPPVVLFVGSIFNRRRVPDLMRAFARAVAKAPDARLEIVGDNRTHPPEDLRALATSLGVAGRVDLRSYVPHDELGSLYARARAFAFLSEYEGFGFTPLEAVAHLVPIVVLDTPVAREIYGDAALYVAAGDLAGTSAALEQLLLDGAFRQRQIERGQRVLERYCWPDAARRTFDALEEAARA